MSDDILIRVQEALDRLIGGDLDEPVEAVTDPALEPVQAKIEHLRLLLKELQEYTVALSLGKLNEDAPPRSYYLATEFNAMVEQLRIREQSLLAQRDTMFSIFDYIEPIVIVQGPERNRVVYVNRLATLRFGIDRDAPLSESANPVMESLRMLSPGEGSREMLDETSGRWYSLSCLLLPWSGSEDVLLYHCHDITAHKLRQSDLERAAKTDNLTGLYNRRAFEAMLENAWDDCRKMVRPLSMLLFDIDHFKKYNDTNGHLQGDKCLSTLARALQRRVERQGDIVARYGGEEFVALLPFTDRDGAMTVGESVRSIAQELAIPGVLDATNFSHITVSVGVCTVVPGSGMLPARMILAADSALYKAKERGRNQVRYADLS